MPRPPTDVFTGVCSQWPGVLMLWADCKGLRGVKLREVMRWVKTLSWHTELVFSLVQAFLYLQFNCNSL